MDDRQHIVLICSRLDQPGGTERAVVNLAHLLAGKGEKITILILDETPQSFYSIDPAVRLVHYHLHFGIQQKGNRIARKVDLYRHIRQLKKILSRLQADIVIGSEYHFSIAAWLSSRNLPLKVFAWEHHHINWLKKNRFWTFLFRRIYPRLDAVICQNEREKEYHEALGCAARVIPYSLPAITNESAPLDKKQILSIGWLIHRKGADLIPLVAEKVFSRLPDWSWIIIGRGEEEEQLRNGIRERGLQNHLLIYPPASQELKDFYLSSSLFVMTSRMECLPMVLLEATSYGLPCVAFDCPTGPAEIILHGETGFLAPLEDTEHMAASIIRLAENQLLRRQMGKSSKEASARFAPERVYRLWKQLFEE